MKTHEPHYTDLKTTWTQTAYPHSVLLYPNTKKVIDLCAANYGMTKKHIINAAVYEYYNKLKRIHGLPKKT